LSASPAARARARDLLRRAARKFGTNELRARARCVVAEAEVALAMRDFRAPPRTLAAAATTLTARADHANALQAHLIATRRVLLLGRVAEAADTLAHLDAQELPPALLAVAELAAAELALRSLHTAAALAALDRAFSAATRARIPALIAEATDMRAAFDRPAARRAQSGEERSLRLAEVETLLDSGALVIDACRRGLRAGESALPLARRPVLFELARALAEAWPGDVDRNELIASLARIEATARGFALKPLDERDVVVLLPPIDGDDASLLALLADGAAWSTSALALALGDSQRTVQRARVDLEAAGRVRSIGRARAQRWLSPSLAGFATILLLPAVLPSE
jgi:hypothetical protein